MTLQEAVQELQSDLEVNGELAVVIMTKADDGELWGYPVVGVSVDEEDQEINLLTNETPSAADPVPGLRVTDLIATLQPLLQRGAEFSVGSSPSGNGSAAAGNGADSDEGPPESPVVGVAMSPEDGIFGFLGWPPDQWSDTE